MPMKTGSLVSRLTPAGLISLALISAVGAIHAQQNIPPPPKPPDSGPSLEVTLKFIVDKIGQEGKLTYSATVSDSAQQGPEWTNKFEVELSNPNFDTSACQISYHWRAVQNGNIVDDKDYTLNLRAVQDMVVVSQEENQHQVDARNRHDTWQSRITPPVFVLVARRPKKVENAFLFSEEDMAHRVAKAMVHAVEVCGGGNNEPF
jgi:hypothetical protein